MSANPPPAQGQSPSGQGDQASAPKLKALPKNLTGKVVSSPTTNLASKQTAPPEDPSHEVEYNPRFGLGCYVAAFIVVTFLVGSIIWVLGNYQRNGRFLPLPTVVAQTISSIPIDSRNGVQLFLEQNDGSSRVLVKQANQVGWLLVSRDDTSATNPSLSPDGTMVTYLSRQQDGQIVVASIQSVSEVTISAEAIKELGASTSVGELKICIWTPIVWAPKGNRVAFFGCGLQDTFSVALVSDLVGADYTIKVAPHSRLDTPTTRSLKWVDSTHLSFDKPAITVAIP